MKVKIDSTSSKYKKEIREFENLQDAIWYCWKIADDQEVIVSKPFAWDTENKIEKKIDYDFELEIYDDYRE